MRFLFRTRRFKIALTVICIILAISIIIKIAGGMVSPGASVMGNISAPFQKIAVSVADFFTGIDKKLNKSQELIDRNGELQKEVDTLTQQLLDYQEATQKNEFYEKYLEIKDEHSDFEFEPALLTAYDAEDEFYSFNINKGSLAGIAVHDPVITSQGLVGYVSQVAPSYSKVTTVLSPAINVGGNDNRTGDAGVVTGHLSVAGKGVTRLTNLSRSCSVAIGDHVVTTGGGVFPGGLLIGTVSALDASDTNNSLYATVTPAADIKNISQCMVITGFAGQGIMLSESAGE